MRIMYILMFMYILTLFLTSCAHSADYNQISKYIKKGEVVYLSSDLLDITVFSKERTRFGPTDLTIANPEWPAYPAVNLGMPDGVQCVSVGEPEIATQYAVKRPLRAGEQYRCLKTIFRVVQCFWECRAAIIEIDRPLSGDKPGAYQSYMYVDNCRGVIILSTIADLRKGIPINAEWLRGEAGILAHPDYPRCRPL
jgi:hypothetical protein